MAYPFAGVSAVDLEKCKREFAASKDPKSYRCCARVGTDAGSGCNPPSIAIPFPFSILSNLGLDAEYKECKERSAGNQKYQCCVNPSDSCKKRGGAIMTGSACPRGMTRVFGPYENKVCCKPGT
ncbi:MAG: hypothetical protein EBX52_00765 [Proteobacteria bacterium]|nr:hypothetical protein [Pseudomonadota bacterium]